ncbi:hypothetical protein MVES1_003423 [Malassezia vespertilionis]|uniref:Large ribosomal subunit protein eL14 domain-containing protein n=1 Tax=Malassezia vespertilionis TaxID=2020962 RepID=A0A2N1J7G0_9BASI|nr:uncharacterized protein MVES1_003423 [Malassezia vespertilionis]PKI82489.1 hypothetical protein MVES_003662 [Malassezia vespertilionis]WFD08054.1 hypothetical protein MVES1_003423 [Malassezia vespertilionis]
MGIQESFKRYVEVGRVVLINTGEHKHKLAVIVEIVDQNRQAVIDGPVAGVPRQVLRYSQVTLTRFVIKLPRGAHTPVVKKAFEASGVTEQWNSSKWAKTLKARELRRNNSDFDRFKAAALKQQRRRVINTAAKKVQA